MGILKATATETLIFDTSYKNYSFSFEILKENETFSIEHKNNILFLYRENNEKEKKLIKSWENVSYGDYQISKDKKKIIFSINNDEYYQPTFLIDGIKGITSYLFEAPIGYQTDENIYFLIGTDWIHKNKQQTEYNEIITHKLNVYNINPIKLVDILEWSLVNKYGHINFYRSLNSNYDFRLIYDSEHLLYAESFYNAKNKKFDIIKDLTNISPEQPLNYKVSKEEVGF